MSKDYLLGIRSLCDKYNLALIYDEIQVGMGRTGTLFAYEQFGVTPDIMTLAKALGNGLPIGVVLATEKVASSFVPGDHASTFGGNPIACAAALAVMKIMLAPGFLPQVVQKGEYLAEKLMGLAREFPTLAVDVRGMGLIQGLVLTEKGVGVGTEIVNALFQKGVLANFAGGAVLRFLPPLVVGEDEIDTMIAHLREILAGQ